MFMHHITFKISHFTLNITFYLTLDTLNRHSPKKVISAMSLLFGQLGK